MQRFDYSTNEDTTIPDLLSYIFNNPRKSAEKAAQLAYEFSPLYAITAAQNAKQNLNQGNNALAAIDTIEGILSAIPLAGRTISKPMGKAAREVVKDKNKDLLGALEPKNQNDLLSNISNDKADQIAKLRAEANAQRFGEEIDTSYRVQHQAKGYNDGDPIRLDDLTKSIDGGEAGYPDDFYTARGRSLYAPPARFPDDEYGIANTQSYDAIVKAKGNPEAEVTIYRAVPNEENITKINEGDFVTLSPKYAELHGASGYGSRGEDAGKILSQKVKVKDLLWDGNDVNEFGYFPSK